MKPNALPNKKIADGGCNLPAVGLQLHLVTTAEAAQLLGCSVRTIRYWEMQGKMPKRIEVGRSKLYRVDQLPGADRRGA